VKYAKGTPVICRRERDKEKPLPGLKPRFH
jgi:hypothetical protein